MQKVSDSTLRTLLICSFRYALGRATYISTEVSGLLMEYRKVLTESDILLIVEDINQAIKNNTAGMEMDARAWEYAAEALKTGREAGDEY